jgi:sialate O-acetylesterase
MRTPTRHCFKIIPSLAIGALFAASAMGAVRLPAVFGDHMVIQQDKPVTIWGWAIPQEAVTVRLAGHEAAAMTGPDGRWKAVLPAVKA